MSLTRVTVPQFKGLRLDADPGDLGPDAAVNCRNVVIGPDGTIRTRPGVALRSNTTLPSFPKFLITYDVNGSVAQASGQAGAGVTSIRTYNGVSLAANAVWSFPTVVGASGAVLNNASGLSKLYVAGSEGLVRLENAGPVEITTQARGYYLAQQAADGRGVLAYANHNGTPIQDRVHFSNPSNADVWGPTDYVDVSPGDFEPIRGAASWRDLVFVFKGSKFFVFYGNSKDATGGAVFNYRSVTVGIGLLEQHALCSAQDGLYFVSRSGIYRTTGDVPVKVSAALDPYFRGEGNGFFSPRISDTSYGFRLQVDEDNLYFLAKHSLPDSTDLFILNFATNEWTYHVLPMTVSVMMLRPDVYSVSSGWRPGLLVLGSETGVLYEMSPRLTDDLGTPIASFYESGLFAPADGDDARLRGFDVWGTGAVTHSIAADYGTADVGAALTLGSTAPARAHDNVARQARLAGVKFAGTGQWSVNRWSAFLADAKVRP